MSQRAELLFNPFDAAFRADPYAAYARLRDASAVHWTPWGAAALPRYADCAALLRDPRASSDMSRLELYRNARDQGLIDPDEALAKTPPFLILDPPEHTRLRGLASKAFTPRVVDGMRPRIEQIVDDLLEQVAPGEPVELIESVAYPLPVRVVCELLGVPPEDHETFKGWSRLLSQAIDPQPSQPPEAIAARRQAGNAFVEYFRALLNQRRRSPKGDLLSSLAAAEEAGDKLSEDELLSTCILLLAAGHETTVSLISNGVLAFARHPDQYALLHSDPSLARSAVEELLRYDGPVQFAFRVAREEFEIEGQVVSPGGQVIALLASANRDPAQFPDPERLDITRNDSRHLAFGMGIHFCLGAPLARLEGEVFFHTVAGRYRGVSLAEEPVYKPNVVNRGMRSLSMRFAT